MALSCVTCECEEVLEYQIKSQISQNHSNSNNQKFDICSPFCNCSCCPASAFYFQSVCMDFKPPIKINVTKKFEILNQHFTSFNLQNIWQPPKNC